MREIRAHLADGMQKQGIKKRTSVDCQLLGWSCGIKQDMGISRNMGTERRQFSVKVGKGEKVDWVFLGTTDHCHIRPGYGYTV